MLATILRLADRLVMTFEVFERKVTSSAKRARHAKHGTRSRYNAGCSCDDCREAQRLYITQLKRRLHARLLDDPTQVRHGSRSTYINWGCRCDDCTEANSRGLADWKRRTGYSRRKS